MEIILKKIGIEDEKIKEIKNTKTFAKIKNIKSLKKMPIEILDSLKIILDKIKALKDSEYITNIYNEYSFFEQFIRNEIKIRIPTIGIYSSGKSSLLNTVSSI